MSDYALRGRLAERRLIIDLHTHTHPEWDESSMTLDELVLRAKEEGLDGVCVTDHDRFLDAAEARRASEAHGLLVLPGSEVTTDEGHVLVFGLTGYVFGMHRVSFLGSLVRKAGGAIVAAHPYRRSYPTDAPRGSERYRRIVRSAGRNPLYGVADAVEVLNGRGSKGENEFAHDLSVELGMARLASSDAHRIEDIGTFATEFERPIGDLGDLITELRAGRARPVVLDMGTWPHDIS